MKKAYLISIFILFSFNFFAQSEKEEIKTEKETQKELEEANNPLASFVSFNVQNY